MTTMDIHKTRFEAVEICGVPALFTVERVRRSELPNGILPTICRPPRRTGHSRACWPAISLWSITVQCLPASASTCQKMDTVA